MKIKVSFMSSARQGNSHCQRGGIYLSSLFGICIIDIHFKINFIDIFSLLRQVFLKGPI